MRVSSAPPDVARHPRPGSFAEMPLRPALVALVERLHAETPEGAHVSLDALGEAIGTAKVDATEIDAMIAALEAKGRVVGDARAPTHEEAAAGDDARPRTGALAPGEKHLARVLAAARVLREELGRTPTRAEIAARAGLDEAEVAHALALAATLKR